MEIIGRLTCSVLLVAAAAVLIACGFAFIRLPGQEWWAECIGLFALFCAKSAAFGAVDLWWKSTEAKQ